VSQSGRSPSNNIEVDDRGDIYGVDRAHRGMHGLELTEAERAIANLPQPHNSLLTP